MKALPASRTSRFVMKLCLALGLSGGLLFFTSMPAWAHALPTNYDPPQNAVLKAPPSHVQIRFSEHVNPDISRIVVVNPSNQEVDNHDTHLSGDALTMTVTLPLLPPGTYVVAWRTHSADDGHIAGGSYIFHIARADGTVPPLSGALPSGHFPGDAGNAPSNGLDVFTISAALARWAGTVALAVLLGMMAWWLFVIPRQPSFAERLRVSIGARMAQSADLALEAIVMAAIAELLLQAIALEGSARGVTDFPLLTSILLQSRFGQFLLVRVVLAVLGLVVVWTPVLHQLGSAPARKWVVALFGLALTLAFLYSGHGGSALIWWGPLVDLLHLIAMGIWLGGLLTLTLSIFPVLRGRPRDEQATYIAVGLPAFSLPAIICVATLAITGPLNADVRMKAISQLWTTLYGQVLLLKIALFLLMVAISYLHAFRLRPRLAANLALPVEGASPARIPLIGWIEARLSAFERWQAPSTAVIRPDGIVGAVSLESSQSSGDIVQAIERWIRFEAACGAGVLLCAALLSPLSVTLAPSLVTSTTFGASGGTQTFTQAADQLHVKFTISPGHFGTNQVTVVVTNPDGTLASDGTIIIVSNMVEMDMGTNTFTLSPAAQPGTYQGAVDLPMAGHWQLQTIIRTRQDPNTLHRTTFTVAASF